MKPRIKGYWFAGWERLEKEGWSRELWPEEYRLCGEINPRYTPRTVWREYEPIDKEVIKKAKAKEKKYLDWECNDR